MERAVELRASIMKSACRISLRLVIAGFIFPGALRGAQPDLVATDVYFRDQPGNMGNQVDNPEIGQQLYPYFSYTLIEQNVSGKIWSIELDGIEQGSYTTSDLEPGTWVGWSTSPWTVTGGNHTLRGVLDPNGAIAESNELNDVATRSFMVGMPDLIATDVYFRDQPGNVGNRVDNPVAGQQLYLHLAFNLDNAAALTGTIWNLELDGAVLCSRVATEPMGSRVGWCISPWTVTTGNHALRGVLDPDGTFAEIEENNNIAIRNITAVTAVKSMITSPVPDTVLNGPTVTFQWSSGSGVSEYWLSLGTTTGGTNIYAASQGTNRAVTVNGLPTDGGEIKVRLWSKFWTDNWQYVDYAYTAASTAGSVSRLWTFTGHTGVINSLNFSPDGTLLLTASEDETARLWSTVDCTQTAVLIGHNGAVNAAVFTPDGHTIMTGSSDALLKYWNFSGSETASIK
jgi:WD domain, G-beta repeat